MRKEGAMTTLCEEIVSDPNLHRGEPVIAGTGLRVRTIVVSWKLGVPLEEMLQDYPHITMAQLFAALYFYEKNKEQIDEHIRLNHVPDEWSGKRYDFATGQVVEP